MAERMLQGLAERMGEQGAARVFAGLRTDALLWAAMDQPEGTGQLLTGDPGELALRSLGISTDAADWRAAPLTALESPWAERAQQAYLGIHASLAAGPTTLAEAALLAFALRERRAKSGAWSGVAAEIQQRTAPNGNLHAGWATALACLTALVPDAEDLLRALLPRSLGKHSMEWMMHAALCQPAHPDEQSELFVRLLTKQPLDIQCAALRSLCLHGLDAVAGEVAAKLLQDHPALGSLRAQTSLTHPDWAAMVSRAFLLHGLGTLYQVAGNLSQAMGCFYSAEESLRQCMAGMYVQELNVCQGDLCMAAGEETLRWQAIGAAAGKFPEELGALLLPSIQNNEQNAQQMLQRVTQVDAEGTDALLQIVRAAQLGESDWVLAREFASQGVKLLIERSQSLGLAFWSDYVYAWQPVDALDALVRLELPTEALTLARELIRTRPTDLALLDAARQLCENSDSAEKNNHEEAASYAQAAVLLQPANPVWRRALGRLWMRQQQWQLAYGEFHRLVVENAEVNSADRQADRLSLASCAFYSNRAAEAADLAEAILAADANDGAAAAIAGRALAALGEKERAFGYLSLAVTQLPEQPVLWRTLADLQEQRGEPERALETLRSAAAAMDETQEDAADVLLALGERCAEQGILEEALPALQRAVQRAAKSSPVAIQAAYLLGRCLRLSGQTEEAQRILQTTRAVWDQRAEVAYEAALAAQDMQDLATMIESLDAAQRVMAGVNAAGTPTAPLCLDGLLLYARLLLGDLPAFRRAVQSQMAAEVRYPRAERTLKELLRRDPDQAEARLLLAQADLEQGHTVAALAALQSLATLPAVIHSDMLWRVQWQMARAAGALGKVEMAVSLLREAAQARPAHLLVHQALAEMCARAGLLPEGLAAGRHVLSLAGQEPEAMAWYAGFAYSLGERMEALRTLEGALRFDPNRSDLRVQLAEWQVENGNTVGALANLKLLSEHCANAADWQRAAHLYLRLHEPAAALHCLESALPLCARPSADLALETCALQEQLGSSEAALQTVQRILEDAQPMPRLEVARLTEAQAHLLAAVGQNTPAQAAFERALRLAEAECSAQNARADAARTDALHRDEKSAERTGAPLTGVTVLAHIHASMAEWLAETGQAASALLHAEKAVELQPDQPELRYRAAGLALGLLQPIRAAQMMSLAECPALHQMEFIALRAEIALAGESDTAICPDAVEPLLQEGLEVAAEEPRLLAIQARCLSRQAETLAAAETFRRALQIWQQTHAAGQPGVWMAEAALEAGQWTAARKLAGQYAAQHPGEIRAALLVGRVWVTCAEQSALAAALGCESHLPGGAAREESARLAFEQTMKEVFRLANCSAETADGEIRRWWARGMAAFHPTLAAARGLLALPANPQDIAALVSLLRQVGRAGGATQSAQAFLTCAAVRVQVALSLIEEKKTQDALEMAQSLAAEQDHQPIYHALLGKAASLAGDLPGALAAYENALRWWPDEPVWHASAAELAFLLHDPLSGMVHREQALALEPERVEYALTLAEAALRSDQLPRAVEVLEAASRLHAQDARVWIALAGAYRQSGNDERALEAARQAAKWDETSAQGYLLAAEISAGLQQMDGAVECARKAVQRQPENESAVLFLSRALAQCERYDEALQTLEGLSSAARSTFGVAFEHAQLLLHLQGAGVALPVLEALAEDHPDEPALLTCLANLYAQNNRMTAAQACAFQSLELNPLQPELTYQLGVWQHKAGQLDQAVNLLVGAIRMNGEQLEAYLELGEVYVERRETGLAVQTYRQATRIAPQDHRAYSQCGLLLRDMKDYAAAETMLRRAAELDPNNTTLRRQLVAVMTLKLVHN